MEGKSNNNSNLVNHMSMGDVVLSPSPSPLQQQNFGGGLGSHSPGSVGAGCEIAKAAVRMPTITFENVITQRHGEQPEESEEDLQEQIPGKRPSGYDGRRRRHRRRSGYCGICRRRFYRMGPSDYYVTGTATRKKGFRKRKKSLHATGGGNDGNYLPPYKHRRMFIRRHASCPSGGAGGLPLKFLLGGNAHDPLNLNGLGDSDNAVTPKTSPMPGLLPTQQHHQLQKEIPIMIPKNYQDPLRLMSEDVENSRDVIEGILPEEPPPAPAPSHKRRRHRRRSLRKRNESGCSIESLASADEGDLEAETAAVIAENHIQDLSDEVVVVHPVGLGSRKVVEQTSTPNTEPKGEVSSSSKKHETGTTGGKDKEEASTIPVKEGTAIDPPVTPKENGEGKPEAEADAVMADLEPTFPFRVSSEYIPLSSSYQPSPFVLDTMNENFTVLPFESPSMSNYMGTQDTFTITEPFSPPPRPMYMDVMIEHRVPSGHYCLGWTPPRNEIQRRQLPPQPPTVTQQAMFNRRHRHRLDPIVSPVFPNLGGSSSGKRSWAAHNHGHARHNHKKQQEPKLEEKSEKERKEIPKQEPVQSTRKFRPKDQIFRFGNYNQYYGYRNNGQQEDARLRAFKKEWLEGKDVLDIGCNIGHVTLCLGRDCAPRRIVGVDIDAYLIKVANKNIKHYVDRDPNDVSVKFPQALSIIHGTLQPPQLEAVTVGCTPEHVGGTPGELPRKRIPFPYNVCFRQVSI